MPQPEKWHPEIDTGVHQLLALREAVNLGGGVAVRFAVLMHDLGKGATPADVLPSHHGHEDAGVALVEQLCARLRVPNPLRELARASPRAITRMCIARCELRADTVLRTLEGCDALRRPERFADFPAGLRGGRARPPRARRTRAIRSAPISRKRARARRAWRWAKTSGAG